MELKKAAGASQLYLTVMATYWASSTSTSLTKYKKESKSTFSIIRRTSVV
jgi:hypothetical protein